MAHAIKIIDIDAKGESFILHEKALKSIEQLKEKLFPSNWMQERSFNFFQFCPDGNYKNKLQNLYTEIEPFNSSILILFED